MMLAAHSASVGDWKGRIWVSNWKCRDESDGVTVVTT